MNKSLFLFVLLLLFSSEIYSGGHKEKPYGPISKIKLNGLTNASCPKLGFCEFEYENEKIREMAKELGFSSRSLQVRILDFEPHALMRFSSICYRDGDWIKQMWEKTTSAIENAKNIRVVGRPNSNVLIGKVYFGQRDSVNSEMIKFSRTINCNR